MRVSGWAAAGWILAGLALGTLPARADCDEPIDGPWDTGVDLSADCDGDGFTPGQGDCDDRDAAVAPDVEEACGDGVDNDCDGFVDGGCAAGAEGSLQGGASCIASSGPSTLGAAAPLVGGLGLGAALVGRRRRRGRQRRTKGRAL